MPGIDGLEVLKLAKGIDPGLAVLVITGFGSVESAVDAMKQGADDYLQKTGEPGGAAQARGGRGREAAPGQEVRQLKERLEEKFSFGTIVGASKSMQEVLHHLALVAPTRSSVLIVGESGTGKELIANALHQNSPRKEFRFLPINCAAIPSEILESELFGHERGAFTGAVQRKQGKFELADRGTLFLDEIGEMAVPLQAKLLRVLEDRSFMRVGGTETITVDVRIIAATNSDLEAKVAAGTFRSDLYYRLKVVTISVPPLRERREDIPILAHRFFEMFKGENDRPNLQLSPEVLEALVEARWEGNVRELRNLIESLVVLADAPTRVLTLEHLPSTTACVSPRRCPRPRPRRGPRGAWRTSRRTRSSARCSRRGGTGRVPRTFSASVCARCSGSSGSTGSHRDPRKSRGPRTIERGRQFGAPESSRGATGSRRAAAAPDGLTLRAPDR